LINYDYTQIRYSLNIPTLSFRRELADITFIHKLINGVTDASDLLSCIPFNIPAYNNRSTPLFYIQVHSTNYLKNSPIPISMAVCNELSKRIDNWINYYYYEKSANRFCAFGLSRSVGNSRFWVPPFQCCLCFRTLNINARGAVRISQAVAKNMIDAGIQGSIVNVSSTISEVCSRWYMLCCEIIINNII